MFRTSICTAFVATVALGVAFAPIDVFASKEKFVRNKPHVNIGSSGLDGVSVKLEGPGGDQTTTTDENGEFWFEGLQPGANKLFIGSLSNADFPPDPIKITIEQYAHPTSAKSSKPREIVVVGSKGKSKEAFFVKVDRSTTTQNAEEGGQDALGDSDSDGLTEPQEGQSKPKPKPKPKPGSGTGSFDTEIVALSLHSEGDTQTVYIELIAMDLHSTGDPLIIRMSPEEQGDSFFDVFFDIEPTAAMDSFFDIIIEIGEDSIRGKIEYVTPDDGDSPVKPDIPDRPEIIERPDTPERPRG